MSGRGHPPQPRGSRVPNASTTGSQFSRRSFQQATWEDPTLCPSAQGLQASSNLGRGPPVAPPVYRRSARFGSRPPGSVRCRRRSQRSVGRKVEAFPFHQRSQAACIRRPSSRVGSSWRFGRHVPAGPNQSPVQIRKYLSAIPRTRGFGSPSREIRTGMALRVHLDGRYQFASTAPRQSSSKRSDCAPAVGFIARPVY